eukprot:4981633-Amphidinium_carterae.2
MMLADPLTKLDVGGHHALTEALRSGRYRFIEMDAELTRRSENPALKANANQKRSGNCEVASHWTERDCLQPYWLRVTPVVHKRECGDTDSRQFWEQLLTYYSLPLEKFSCTS